MVAYVARRDHRFHRSSDAIEHIEQHNCVKGCKVPDPAYVAEFGPGGDCPLLAQVSIGDGEPVLGLADDGQVIICLVREPLT